MPRKALPRKQAKVDTGHPCFSVVAQAKAKILPRLAQSSCQVKELDRTTKANAEMYADWKVDKAQYAEFNVPTCDKIAVWQLCKERQPLWNSHDGLNLTCLDQCHRVRSHGKSSSQSWRNRIVIQQSESILERTPTIADSILVSDQTDLFSFATHGDEYGMPRKALPRKQAMVDTGHPCFSVVAQARAKILPRLAQGSCQVKELDRTTKANAEMNADWKVEKAQYAEFNVPTCDKIAVWQLCKERQPLWNSHDGLNLTCLDQCHRVRSHGKSSSQSWCNRIVIQQSESKSESIHERQHLL